MVLASWDPASSILRDQKESQYKPPHRKEAVNFDRPQNGFCYLPGLAKQPTRVGQGSHWIGRPLILTLQRVSARALGVILPLRQSPRHSDSNVTSSQPGVETSTPLPFGPTGKWKLALYVSDTACTDLVWSLFCEASTPLCRGGN